MVQSDVLINQINEVRAYGFKWVSTPTVQLSSVPWTFFQPRNVVASSTNPFIHSPGRLCVPFIVFSSSWDIMCRLIIYWHTVGLPKPKILRSGRQPPSEALSVQVQVQPSLCPRAVLGSSWGSLGNKPQRISPFRSFYSSPKRGRICLWIFHTTKTCSKMPS